MINISNYIEIDPLRCGGKPVVFGTRIPVSVVIDQLADTGSIDVLLKKYPELTAEKVAGVLRYCNAIIAHTDLEPVLT